MVKKHAVFVGILCGVASFWGIVPLAQADTPLTHASIEQLRNQVDFIPSGESARFAQLSDRLHPGDALSTYQEAFAELEFNDGSLARVGELALFRFQPNTRTFELDNGTMLLLIPPGQGTSRLRTPNATAGIRGSALFVRHIPGKTQNRSITLVGALTTSGIEVSNIPPHSGNKSTDETTSEATLVELEAGQMAVILGNEAPQVLTFDLELFGQTSSLASGLNLYGHDTSPSIWQDAERSPSPLSEPDGSDLAENEQSESDLSDNDPIDLVREEVADGLLSQAGTLTGPYFDNPAFIYGGDWQVGTALFPSSQPERTQDGSNYDDTIDSIIDAVDIQTLQPTLQPGDVVDPPSAIPTPSILGPIPNIGPNPAVPLEVPSVPNEVNPEPQDLIPTPVLEPSFSPGPSPSLPPVVPMPMEPSFSPSPEPSVPAPIPTPTEPSFSPTPDPNPPIPTPTEPSFNPTPSNPPAMGPNPDPSDEPDPGNGFDSNNGPDPDNASNGADGQDQDIDNGPDVSGPPDDFNAPDSDDEPDPPENDNNPFEGIPGFPADDDDNGVDTSDDDPVLPTENPFLIPR